MGAILGSLVAPLDERLDGACLLVGGGRWDLLIAGSAHPAVEAIRKQFPDAGPIRQAMTYLEPTQFIGHLAPRPLLMVNGRQDQIVPPESGQALFQAACEPKEIVWYDGGHIPPLVLILPKVTSFLRTMLKLPAETPAQP